MLNSKQLDGYKPIQYAEIPDFDQSAQYVVQSDPIDNGDHIFIGIEIRQLQLDEGDDFGEPDVF